jgi:hypothetical protein
MRTPKQIAASRANGAKSKGPVTAQGKRNFSRNSTRHGMFGAPCDRWEQPACLCEQEFEFAKPLGIYA